MIALVGADGAGKSTVTAALAERLAAAGTQATALDRWDIVGNDDYPTSAFMVNDTRMARSCAARMSPTTRFLFLMWASLAAVTERCADGGSGPIVVMDGYWIKHAASEVAYGLDQAWVEAVVTGFPAAERVIYLRIDAETAWRRKQGTALPYECAMDMSCSRGSFVAHQGKIHRLLDDWADQFEWTIVDGLQPLPIVVDEVVSVLNGHPRSAISGVTPIALGGA